MSNNTQILIRALEASGSQREADLARAILGDAAPPAAAPAAPEQTPGQKYVAEQAAAAERAVQAPEGVMSLEEIDAWEKRPTPKSSAEQQRRIAETDRVMESLRYHGEQS